MNMKETIEISLSFLTIFEPSIPLFSPFSLSLSPTPPPTSFAVFFYSRISHAKKHPKDRNSY